MLNKTRIWVVGLLAATAIAGCSSTKVIQQPNLNVSIGQQLIDLKKARDAGAISDREFERQKERLIDNVQTY